MEKTSVGKKPLVRSPGLLRNNVIFICQEHGLHHRCATLTVRSTDVGSMLDLVEDSFRVEHINRRDTTVPK